MRHVTALELGLGVTTRVGVVRVLGALGDLTPRLVAAHRTSSASLATVARANLLLGRRRRRGGWRRLGGSGLSGNDRPFAAILALVTIGVVGRNTVLHRALVAEDRFVALPDSLLNIFASETLAWALPVAPHFTGNISSNGRHEHEAQKSEEKSRLDHREGFDEVNCCCLDAPWLG